MTAWLDNPQHRHWLRSQADSLLAFAAASPHPAGGFSWLGADGAPDLSRPVELWITCRMIHCFSLGHMLGNPAYGRLADHGLRSLNEVFRDREYGGFYASVQDGLPRDTSKQAYAHAFVVLAAASATAAGRAGAADLLTEALSLLDERFFDPENGMSVDSYDRAFSDCEPYRGINANMHTVEALLSAADVTGERRWLDRACEILRRALDEFARGNNWLLPEHFDTDWRVLLDYNREVPDHPFRPYGATVGHWFEWGRLALHAEAALRELGDTPPAWLSECARELITRAADTFGCDGQPGFVYTLDWQGQPVVHERMHWVAAEAIGACAVAYRAFGDESFARLYEKYWEYVSEFLLDPACGSWHHELDRDNRVQGKVWPGKPDTYHALQAVLLPRLPLTPTFAQALRRGLISD
ncbi:AGE family epimerase/isomerase [Dermabacteraceae bacterium TAE3-ERU27]|nr:AGE family epimerase/isomerase [Dermabacteraceae bacterium TAE3-ERU27]